MEKIYKEPNKSETETTINVLYSENMLSIYTNKVNLQKQLNKLLGAPTKEDKIKRSIAGSRWNISLNDKAKIQNNIENINSKKLSNNYKIKWKNKIIKTIKGR